MIFLGRLGKGFFLISLNNLKNVCYFNCMNKLLTIILTLSLSACGGGSDALETVVTDAATKQAEEAATAAAIEAAEDAAAAAQKAIEDAALETSNKAIAARSKAIAAAESILKLNRYGGGNYENQKFQ